MTLNEAQEAVRMTSLQDQVDDDGRFSVDSGNHQDEPAVERA